MVNKQKFIVIGVAVALMVWALVRLSAIAEQQKHYHPDQPTRNSMPEAPPYQTVIVTATLYNLSTFDGELRFQLALSTVRRSIRLGIPIIIADSSSDQSVRDQFIAAGAKVTALRRPAPEHAGKGHSVRGVLEFAKQFTDAQSCILFLEPEKQGIVQYANEICRGILSGRSDVVIPARCPRCFHSLPVEQKHSETFGNLHLANIARQHGFEPASLDWFFGPFALRAHLSTWWLQYEGRLWDATVVPMVLAWRSLPSPLRIASHEVQYTHPAVQTKFEEGNTKYSAKRLFQLQYMVEHISRSFGRAHGPGSDPAEPTGN